MKEGLAQAIKNTELVYDDLKIIADEMFKPWAEEANELIEKAKQLNTLTNDQVRDLMFKLATKSFSFSETRVKAAFKAACSKALREEAYAKEYALAEGAVEAKKTSALANTSAEILSNTIYDMVADLFKVKLDELHRVVDVLKTVLTTRLTEARLSANIQETL